MPEPNTRLQQSLNRQQLQVYDLLREFATEHARFHEWYEAAVVLINSSSPDNISQAAHSIRELCDKLPGCVADIPQFNSPLAPVKSLQKDFLTVKTTHYPDGWIGKPINSGLNKLLLRLDEIFTLFNEPARTARLRLALTRSDLTSDFMSTRERQARDEVFESIGKFFQDAAHHRQPVSETEFRNALEAFESLLLNYLTPCTAAQQGELLHLIKQAPTPEHLNRVKELISYKGANFVLFFDKLDNPGWLEPLDDMGYFTELPSSEPTSEGRIVYRPSVPLLSLCRLAEAAPEKVTKILLKLKLPDNPRVGDQVLQCMAKIRDRVCIPQLRPLFAQLRANLSRTSWLWIQELLKSWLALELYPDAFAAAQVFLFSAVDASVNGTSELDGWQARQVCDDLLQPLTVRFPLESANLAFKALCRWVNGERKKYGPGEIGESAPTSYWLEDFRNPTETRRDIEGALAQLLFAAAEQVYKQGDNAHIAELDSLLRSNDWELFRRLRWQLYAEFPELSAENARADTLARLPFLNRFEHSCGSHDQEFARLLKAHAAQRGDAFLTPEEVKRFFHTVMAGPVDEHAKTVEGLEKDVFVRKQLWPISCLLRGAQLDIYRSLSLNEVNLTPESYKPFSGGGGCYEVVSSAPSEAENLEVMSDDALWNFLNTWQPKKQHFTPGKWHREDSFALGGKFAELVSRKPERFHPSTKWWENLRRPVILYKCLERATDHFMRHQNEQSNPTDAPTETDWGNWFGVVAWISVQKQHFEPDKEKSSAGEPGWECAWESIPRFLRMALKSGYDIPQTHLSELQGMLPALVHADKTVWRQDERPARSDWLTTAINSTRGETIESLLYLAARQQKSKEHAERWIFDLIVFCLSRSEESPCVFALLGANLRFFVSLFRAELAEAHHLLFPADRPVHRAAAIVSHFRYDQPWSALIGVFPDLPELGLGIFQSPVGTKAERNEAEEWRDFGGRLGFHLAVYYWLGWLEVDSAERMLDRFFRIAPRSARANLIRNIGLVFEKSNGKEVDKDVTLRVRRLWERRLEVIGNDLKSKRPESGEFDLELVEFTHWLSCECFPFEWRFKNAKGSIELLTKAPRPYQILSTIPEMAGQAERLHPALQLLLALLKKPSDELRWSIHFKDLAEPMNAGLRSADPKTRNTAEECLDLLLKLGLSDFLSLINQPHLAKS